MPRALGLGDDVASLAKLVRRDDFARFTAVLVRVDLGHLHDDVMEEAAV